MAVHKTRQTSNVNYSSIEKEGRALNRVVNDKFTALLFEESLAFCKCSDKYLCCSGLQ